MNEATPSAITQAVDYLKHNFNFSALFLSSVTFICGLFFSGFTKEFFEERSRLKKHKRDVARAVLKICNEASTGNFEKHPRDMEHINSVLTDLDGVNNNVCKWMEEFVSSWQTIANNKHGRIQLPENLSFIKEERDRAEEKRLKLIKWANKLRAGE